MKKTRSRKSRTVADNISPLAVLTDEASLSMLRSRAGLLSRAWEWLRAGQSNRSNSRRLRVAETVSLGEKRFIAVVQVAGRDFLIAGGPSNIALLAQLDPNEPFQDLLHRTMTVPSQHPPKRKARAKREQSKPKPAAKSAGPPVDRAAAAAAVNEQPSTQFKTQKSSGHVANHHNGRSDTDRVGHWA